MAPLNVLHVLEATLGGTRQHVADLLLSADRQNVRPMLAYARYRADGGFPDVLRQCRAGGIACFEVPMRRTIPKAENLRAVKTIAGLIRRQQVAILHAHSGVGGLIGRLAARFARPRVVVYTPNAWPFLAPRQRFAGWIYQQTERRLAQRTDAIICVSTDEQRLALAARIAPAEKLALIPNGVDLAQARLARAEARALLRLPPEAIVIGSVTRFSRQKDPLAMIGALAPVLQDFSDVHLCLIGDHPAQVERHADAEHHALDRRVHWVGFRQNSASLLAAFDLFLLPSRYEGLSYAVLEAMAAGLPIVTTVGGNADAVRNGENGFLVPVGDASALQSAVATLLSDPALRNRFGARGLELAEQFSVQRMVRATVALYHSLAKQKGLMLPYNRI